MLRQEAMNKTRLESDIKSLHYTFHEHIKAHSYAIEVVYVVLIV